MSTAVITDFSTYATQDTVDGNDKCILANNSLALDEWQDVFNAVYDTTHWLETSLFYGSGGGGTLSKTGGKLRLFSGLTSAGLVRYDKSSQSILTFGNYVSQVDFSGIIETGVAGGGYFSLCCYISNTNRVVLFYDGTSNKIRFNKTVGGVTTEIDAPGVALGSITKLKLQRATDTFTASYYDGSWTSFSTTSAAIGTPATIVLNVWSYGTLGNGIQVDFDNFLVSGSGRYWKDSPTAYLNFGGANGTLDAGAGNTLDITIFASSLTEPAGTSGKFAYSTADTSGYGDGGWSAWKTTAEMDTLAGAGTLSGTRYFCLKHQANSDGTATSDLASVTVTYTAITPGGGVANVFYGNIFHSVIFSEQ